MLIYRILAFIFLAAGFGMVFGSKQITVKYQMDKKVKIDFDHGMSEDEEAQYRLIRASVNVKMMGLILAIPGLVFIVLGFK